MKEVKLSLEVARKMYASNDQSVKAFALENYSKKELEGLQRPNTVIGMPLVGTHYLDGAGYLHTWCYEDRYETEPCDLLHFNTQAEAEACLALAQLTRLRDAWNGELLHEWCDWLDINQPKHCLRVANEEIEYTTMPKFRRVLAFKSIDLAINFMDDPEIRKLIEQAKPLL